MRLLVTFDIETFGESPIEAWNLGTDERLFASDTLVLMLLGRRYRLYPTSAQDEQMRRCCGARRFLYNIAREQRELAFELTGRSPGYLEQCRQLKELRDDSELAPWLREIPVQVLQQALKDLDSAYQRFFKGLASYPRFKRKGESDTFRVPQHVEARKLSRKWAQVKLQGLGWVRYRRSCPLGGEIKNATVKYEAGQWHVAIQVELPDRRDNPSGGPSVGIDRGVVHALTSSDGEFFDLAKRPAKENQRLLRLQRKRARQMMGSANRRKTSQQIAKIHDKRTRSRVDFCHKTTTTLAKKHSTVVIEALKTANMTRSARGTIDEPGTSVAQKAGLNRAILQSGWGLVERQLTYKAEWYGSQLIKVPAAYSSLQCSCCGHTHTENRKNQAGFKCVNCGHSDDADINAARVILGRGKALNQTNPFPAAGPVVDACGRPGVARVDEPGTIGTFVPLQAAA